MPLEVLQIILNFNSNITTNKEFFACSKTNFYNVSGVFFSFHPPPPLFWGAVTFSIILCFYGEGKQLATIITPSLGKVYDQFWLGLGQVLSLVGLNGGRPTTRLAPMGPSVGKFGPGLSQRKLKAKQKFWQVLRYFCPKLGLRCRYQVLVGVQGLGVKA